jgi:hypothetical protein
VAQGIGPEFKLQYCKKKKKKNPEKGQPASGVQKGRFFPEHQIA